MSAVSFSLEKKEFLWLRDNPDFKAKPATISEFLGPDYLDDDRIRPGIRKALMDVFGTEIDPDFISVARRACISGGIGIGKMLDPDEQVLTPTGWVRNKEINVGDFVVGKNGWPTKVLGTFRHEQTARYRVTFKDGSWVNAGADHLWEVWRYKSTWDSELGRPRRREVRFVMDTESLASERLTVGSPSKGSYKYHIPLVEPVEFNAAADLPMSAYAQGKWLTERFANSLSRHQSIPPEYKFASARDRLLLMRGLMDSGGCVRRGNSCSYTVFNEGFAADVMEVARSLGWYCTVTKFFKSGVDRYRVVINSGDVCPFTVDDKKKMWSPRTSQPPRRSIVSVERIEDGPGICIKVDAEDELYVTKDYIVTHNTTFASIALSYCVHWVSCLADPQDYFNLMKGSRISFMMMSTSAKQAREVLFGDIKARIENSPWFQKYCMPDPKYKNQLRFPKDIWIVPGGSKETQFEGYNVLVGILDEGDSHMVTDKKSYADEGWNTINSRIASRFVDHVNETNKGLMIAIGQMKSTGGFMADKYDEINNDSDGVAVRMSIWESFGWYNYTTDKDDAKNQQETSPRKSFYYDTVRKEVIPKLAYGAVSDSKKSKMVEVPVAYKDQFIKDPQKALRDLAGIPPNAEDPFIGRAELITLAQDKWQEDENHRIPVNDDPSSPLLSDDLVAVDNIPRHIHIDIAYSSSGDALGLAMGHVDAIIESGSEDQPVVKFDFAMRIKAPGGDQVDLSSIRELIYNLRDRRGYNIKGVTLDGFESTDTIQQLNKRRLNAYKLSVDKSKMPYTDLRDILYDKRIMFPAYMTHLDKASIRPVNIIYKELSELTDTGNKIDHPQTGSKDVADCIAGVVHSLISHNMYKRGAPRRTARSNEGEFDLNSYMRAKEAAMDEHKVPGLPAVDFETFVKTPEQFMEQVSIPSVDYEIGLPDLPDGNRRSGGSNMPTWTVPNPGR